MSFFPWRDLTSRAGVESLSVLVEDKPGVLAEVTRILSSRGISIEAIVQKPSLDDGGSVPVIILTKPVQERDMNSAIAELEALGDIAGPVTRIRMETLA